MRESFERGLYGEDNDNKDARGEHHPLHFATIVLSGVGAGGAASALTAPLDRIKTRLQTQRLGMALPPVPRMSSTATAAAENRLVWEERAVNAARGEVASCPKQAARQMRDAFRGAPPSVPLLAPPGGGNAAANTAHYATPLQAFRSIVAEEGYRGLFRGTAPRVAMHAPAVAISWTAYETAKGWFVNV